jgi:hypothetical protein
MNQQLRERTGTTVNRDQAAGDEINDALRVARGHEPRHSAHRPSQAEPVGPEPTEFQPLRLWVSQHADLLDAQARLPGESGYDPATVGERDRFDLIVERIARWKRERGGA